ncbi:hypothetical protein ACET8U_00565 [Aeromonas veronii]
MLKLNSVVALQLALADLLAEQSQDQGTQFEDGSYEEGVRDALGWICGLIDSPPYNPDEYPCEVKSLSSMEFGESLMETIQRIEDALSDGI